jgi:hypothetical protein
MVLDHAEGQETNPAVSRVGKSIKIEPLDGNDEVKTVAPPKPQPKGAVPIEVKDAKLSLKPVADPTVESGSTAQQEPYVVATDKAASRPAAPEPAPSQPAAPAPSPSLADTPGQTDGQEAPGDDKQLAASKTLEDAKKKEEEEKAARAAEQEKIIESKKYYLPIHSAKDSRDLHLALVLLLAVIVLGLVWLDIALDAGIIKIDGLHALTHFF